MKKYLIILALVGGCTSPEDCARKYRVLQSEGGILAKYSDIHRYCDLDYGGKWKIKDGFQD